MIAEAQDIAVRPGIGQWTGTRQRLTDYISLTKPRVMTLLLVTELTTALMAARGWPGTLLMLAALVGGACSAGGASAINCWFDRDIDAVMARTCTRPVPSGRIAPANALWFGVALSATGFLVLGIAANLLAGFLALAGGLFYVFVYTLWLKRSSRHNIVIGGAAGAFPPLVGWAVVTGSISPLAVALFAVVLFWTPPHFWSLSLLLERQYRAVGVPMLPVVAGEGETRRAIVRYALVLLGVSILPAIWLGPAYGVGALLLGVLLLELALRGRSAEGLAWASRLFHFSLAYLALLFGLAAGTAILAR